jgi:hypothetical protein
VFSKIWEVQTFKYSDDGVLSAVVTGFNNMFRDANEAEEYVNTAFGALQQRHRHLKKDFYNEGGESLSLTFSTTEYVKKWNRLQISYGCNAYPEFISPSGKVLYGNYQERNKWQSTLTELIGSYSWLTDLNLAKFTSFEIYKDSIDTSGQSRCVLASIIYGERRVDSIGAKPKKVIELVIAEVDPTFPKIHASYWNN